MSQQELKQAAQLIKQKRYEEAAIILQALPDNAKAQEWLTRMYDTGLIPPNINYDYVPDYSPREHPSLPQTHALFPQKSRMTLLVECVAPGAVIATTIATLWVYAYLTSISVVTSISIASYSRSLFDYVTGDAIGSDAFQSIEPLFVIVARFILGFGMSWGPSTLLLFLALSLKSKLTHTVSGSE